MSITISKVGNRLACGIAVRKIAINKDFGVISSIKLTRISLFIWHIQFEVETR